MQTGFQYLDTTAHSTMQTLGKPPLFGKIIRPNRMICTDTNNNRSELLNGNDNEWEQTAHNTTESDTNSDESASRPIYKSKQLKNDTVDGSDSTFSSAEQLNLISSNGTVKAKNSEKQCEHLNLLNQAYEEFNNTPKPHFTDINEEDNEDSDDEYSGTNSNTTDPFDDEIIQEMISKRPKMTDVPEEFENERLRRLVPLMKQTRSYKRKQVEKANELWGREFDLAAMELAQEKCSRAEDIKSSSSPPPLFRTKPVAIQALKVTAEDDDIEEFSNNKLAFAVIDRPRSVRKIPTASEDNSEEILMDKQRKVTFCDNLQKIVFESVYSTPEESYSLGNDYISEKCQEMGFPEESLNAKSIEVFSVPSSQEDVVNAGCLFPMWFLVRKMRLKASISKQWFKFGKKQNEDSDRSKTSQEDRISILKYLTSRFTSMFKRHNETETQDLVIDIVRLSARNHDQMSSE